MTTPIETLCKGFPNEFVKYISYCRNLRFDEKPDYAFLKSLFKDLFAKNSFENDALFDWVLLENEAKINTE